MFRIKNVVFTEPWGGKFDVIGNASPFFTFGALDPLFGVFHFSLFEGVLYNGQICYRRRRYAARVLHSEDNRKDGVGWM